MSGGSRRWDLTWRTDLSSEAEVAAHLGDGEAADPAPEHRA